MFFKRLPILCLWLLLPFVASAQFTIHFEQAVDETTDVLFLSDPDSSGLVSNFFIQEIAKSIPRRFDFTAYKYSFKQVLRVSSTEKGKYEATVDINNAKCTGDVIYKDFDISDVLFPNRIDFKATLLNKYKQELKLFNIMNVPLHWGYNKIALYEFNDTINAPQFFFNVESRKIWFDKQSVTDFNEKLQLIDDYYASKAVIAQGMKRLETFNFTNVDMILVYDIILDEIEKEVEALFDHDFPGKLNLSGHDPIGFIDLFLAFSEKTRQVRAKENECLASLDRIYYERGMKYIAEEDISKATMYFKRSFSYNNYFVPSHYQYAKILFLRDSVDQAALVISKVLSTMNPDPQTHDTVLAFAEKIYNTFLQQGSDYLKIEKFNEALTVFENTIRFCSNSPGITCTSEANNGYASAKFGIYKSYISVSEKAIQNGKFELAEVYISECRKYQQANSNEIIGDAAADAVTAKLAHAIIVKADTMNSAHQYEKALLLYDKAASLCSIKPDIDCGDDLDKGYRKAYNGMYSNMLNKASITVLTGQLDRAETLVSEARQYQELHSLYIILTIPADTIDNKIQFLRYGKSISEGIVLLNYQSFRPALELFAKAQILSQKYPFKKNLKLDSLLQTAAKPVMKQDLLFLDTLIANEILDSAKIILEKLEAQIIIFNLQNDSLLYEGLEKGRGDFEKTKCVVAARNINNCLDSAMTNTDNKDYILAMADFKKALNCADTNADCLPDTLSITGSIQRYAAPYYYQVQMNFVSDYLVKCDTMNYLGEYLAAEYYYLNNEVSKFQLNHIPLIELCRTSNNLHFLLRSFDFYFENAFYTEALTILRYIKDVGTLASKILIQQNQLAVKLAESDHKKNQEANPQINLQLYTSGDKWFTSFKKSYLKTFKSL